MFTSDNTMERKGKFFKAISNQPPTERKKRKKLAPVRTLPALQPRQCRPVDRSSGASSRPTPGPTGEDGHTSVDRGSTDEAATTLDKLSVATDAKCGAAGRCGDDVRNLTELLFNRNFKGLLGLNTGAKHDDISIIQTIFKANSIPQPDAVDTSNNVPTQQTTSSPELAETGTDQPSSVSSVRSSDPNHPNQSTANAVCQPQISISVLGERRHVPTGPAGSDVKEESVQAVTKKAAEIRRTVGGRGRQRGVDLCPMRLPKLTVRTREAKDATSSCETETRGGERSDTMMCRGTKKRSRCRSRSTCSADGTGAFVSYPCPRNLTVIQRRGRRTATRVCSPMPLPRKPLPPIRRRHHSDICTVCPEVHDWKGLARNPRWYPGSTDRPCRQRACERTCDVSAKPTPDVDEDHRKDSEANSEEKADSPRTQLENRSVNGDAAEEVIDGYKGQDKGGSNWFPEKSIPDSNDQDQPMEVKTKVDVTCSDTGTGCNALQNSHCPWLTGGSSLGDLQKSTDGAGSIMSRTRECTNSDHKHKATRMLMEGMDFECDNRTACAFEEDNTFLQAVLLRNHALNHGTVTDPVEPMSPHSEVQHQDSAGSVMSTKSVGERNSKHFTSDHDMLLNCCARVFQGQGSCESTGVTGKEVRQLTATQRMSHMALTPKTDVIMTSRGQQKVVTTSLVAVGRGQSGNSVRDAEVGSTKKESNSKLQLDDSSETLLKQEMNRYLHSLRHDVATDKHHHGLSSAQNIPMKVQNLTAVRPITADVSSIKSTLTNQATKSFGFIPILTREEYEGLCKKTAPGPSARFPRSSALPSITDNTSDSQLAKRFEGEVRGMQLPHKQVRKNKK